MASSPTFSSREFVGFPICVAAETGADAGAAAPESPPPHAAVPAVYAGAVALYAQLLHACPARLPTPALVVAAIALSGVRHPRLAAEHSGWAAAGLARFLRAAPVHLGAVWLPHVAPNTAAHLADVFSAVGTHWQLRTLAAPRTPPDGLLGGVAAAFSAPGLTALSLLHVSRGGIGDAGAIAMAPAVARLTWLTSLCLRRSNIAADGARAVAALAAQLLQLRVLDLSHNRLCDVGAAHVAAGVVAPGALRSLRRVDLSANGVRGRGVAALTAAAAAWTDAVRRHQLAAQIFRAAPARRVLSVVHFPATECVFVVARFVVL
jgi:hypothetical protein